MKTLIARSFVAVFGSFVLVSAASAQTIQLGASSKTQVGVGQAVGVEVGSSASTGADIQMEETVEAEAVILERSSLEESASTTTVAIGFVQDRADLEAYAKVAMRSDEHIKAVESSGERVRMTYDKNARLFGFIPVVVVVHVEVDSEGNVSLQYPWYGFLLRKDDMAIETALSSAAKATIDAHASVQAGMSPKLQATLLAELHAVLKTAFNS